MNGMFRETAFVNLDLSNFDTSKVTTMYQMFYNIASIVGEKGTTYDADHKDFEYARVDDPDNDKPGYFTYKAAPTNS